MVYNDADIQKNINKITRKYPSLNKNTSDIYNAFSEIINNNKIMYMRIKNNNYNDINEKWSDYNYMTELFKTSLIEINNDESLNDDTLDNIAYNFLLL